MFMLIESARAAGEAIVAHALRSTLTTLGVAIGVGSIVAVITFMEGAGSSLDSEVANLGADSLTVRARTSADDAIMNRIGANLDEDDLAAIAGIDDIASIAPTLWPLQPYVELRHGSATRTATLVGTTHAHQDFSNEKIVQGRFLSVADEQRRRRVCVLPERLAETLGLGEEPLGKHVIIAGEWFQVIGIVSPPGGITGMFFGDQVHIPYSTMRAILGQEAGDLTLGLTVADGVEAPVMRRRLQDVLRRTRQIGPGEADDFIIGMAEDLEQTKNRLTTMATILAVGIVGISLVVGGVGIMNIMLVSVTERTREIGILKALGAKRGQILLQFLTEAIVLCLLGGAVGLLLGYLAAGLFGWLLPFVDVGVSPAAAVVAFAFSTVVGMVFGILPAAKAADLRPIDALRYE